MPDNAPAQQTQVPSPDVPTQPQTVKRSRPPGEMGGHTVMPWEQGEGDTAASPTPAGSNPTTSSSGGSSKNVPPPATGKMDGLGQGAGSTTVSAADGMMPPASQAVTGQTPKPVEQKSAPGGAGALAQAEARGKPAVQAPVSSPPMPADALEAVSPEGAEEPRHAMRSKEPALTKAPPAKQPVPGAPPVPAAPQPGVPSAAPTPTSTAAAVTPASAPLDSVAAAKATAVPGKASVPASTSDEALIKALTDQLATMLARALHESVAQAVRDVRAGEARPAAPPAVRSAPQ